MFRKRFPLITFLSVLLCVSLVFTVKADAAMWNQTYGGTEEDFGRSVVETSDGGYAVAGKTESFGSGSSDFWLVKTDVNGTMVWNQTYGGIQDDFGRSVVETSDGGYAIAGYTLSFGSGGSDVWLVKTDANGAEEWNQTYGGTYGEFGFSVVETGDGGFALAGSTASYGAGGYDFWLVKTNASGTLQWNQTYGGTNRDEAYSMVQTSDGGYAITGVTFPFDNVKSDVWLVKTDVNGTMVWNQTYGGTSNELGGNSVMETSDGGYAIAAITASYGAGGNDVWLIKTDEYGIIPEFHFWIILPLLMIAPLFTLILKKKGFRHLLNLVT